MITCILSALFGILHTQQDETTKNAIKTIFYPNRRMREPQSVLLKRGPVLVGGEDERELIMLTNGFVLARVEMDALVDLLLDKSERAGDDVVDDNEDVGEAEALKAEKKLSERFNAIDTDHSGCKGIYAVFHCCFGVPAM